LKAIERKAHTAGVKTGFGVDSGNDEDPEMRPEPIGSEALRLREEIQEVLRWGDGELNVCFGDAAENAPPQSAIIKAPEVAVMKSRQGYKGYVIAARSHELKDGGFSAEFSVEEHDADGVTETEFYLPDTFPTRESAIEAAIKVGRQKIDAGFERGSAVVNG
jgi:hypothetical protein